MREVEAEAQRLWRLMRDYSADAPRILLVISEGIGGCFQVWFAWDRIAAPPVLMSREENHRAARWRVLDACRRRVDRGSIGVVDFVEVGREA